MTAALRIAIVASSRHPIRQPFAGGLESHVWHLARALERVGHQVTLFAADGSDSAVASGKLRVRSFRRVASPAEIRRCRIRSSLRTITPTSGSCWNSRNTVPIASTSCTTTACTICRWQWHRLSRSRWSAPCIPRLRRGWSRPPRSPAASAWIFVAVSGHTAAAWESVVNTPIRVVPNGVDTDAWPLGGAATAPYGSAASPRRRAPTWRSTLPMRAGISLRIAGP
ncbi:glycosyltransferase [Rhodococcus hoagii]|nr:glycosyltransferase [Prescottella equi]